MRVLLTGSSGWLGRFLAPRLRARGHDVTGLDVAPGADTDVIGSVADRALVHRVFAARGIEAVIHAGALHKPDIARYPAEAFAKVNVEGTRNLLEAAAAAGNDRFLFTSTTSLMISERFRAGKGVGRPGRSGSTRNSGRSRPATSTARPSARRSFCAGAFTTRTALPSSSCAPAASFPRRTTPIAVLRARISRPTSSSTAASP